MASITGNTTSTAIRIPAIAPIPTPTQGAVNVIRPVTSRTPGIPSIIKPIVPIVAQRSVISPIITAPSTVLSASSAPFTPGVNIASPLIKPSTPVTGISPIIRVPVPPTRSPTVTTVATTAAIRVSPIAPVPSVRSPVIPTTAVVSVTVPPLTPSPLTMKTQTPPVTTVTVSQNEKEWLQQLQLFLITFLRPIFGNTKFFMQLFTDAAMVIWAKAFTHETISPTDNYEDLEFNGDAILKAVFPKYLQYKLPHLHKKEYTELNNFYMSKIRQAELGNKMGLSKYIRVAGMDRIILNLETDVFESFFGALDVISNTIMEGLGYINCYRLIQYLFQDITIDETKGLGTGKTQVIQIFVRFFLPKPIESFEGEISTEVTISLAAGAKARIAASLAEGTILGRNRDQNYDKAYNEATKETINELINYGVLAVNEKEFYAQNRHNVQFTVSLDRAHINFLRDYGINITNPVIGSATASTKREAELEAYNNALQTLANYGITTQWAEKVKQERDLSDPALQPYLANARARLAKEGYISMRFFIPRKTVTAKGAIVQLVGLRESGREDLLSYTYATSDDQHYHNAKVTVVKQYAKQ